MNAGFSNLTSLKAQLLATKLQSGSDYDAKILAIGLGVAASFEQFCNRKFMRAADMQEIIGADRIEFLLSRLPAEAVSQIELLSDNATGFEALDMSVIRSIDLKNGIVHFPGREDVGDYWMQVRFTYTGGFFWEQLEPTDGGYPSVMPVAASPLPADILFAWQTQCRKVWEAIDKLGRNIVQVGSNAKQPAEVLAGLDLVPEVKNILSQYIRYQMA